MVATKAAAEAGTAAAHADALAVMVAPSDIAVLQSTFPTVAALLTGTGVPMTSVAEVAAETYPPANASGVFLTQEQARQNSNKVFDTLTVLLGSYPLVVGPGVYIFHLVCTCVCACGGSVCVNVCAGVCVASV